MFWDRVAGIYDLFANFINAKAHKVLRKQIADLISASDEVLECACGTGMLSEVIAPKCRRLVATDFSKNMLKQAQRKCRKYGNAEFKEGNILEIEFPDASFDKVVAANVLHLLDEPYKALSELARVCRSGGQIIVPTYMNKVSGGKTSRFSATVGKAGADFKRQFTFKDYQDFFAQAGYTEAEYTMIEGRVPCAVAVISKR